MSLLPPGTSCRHPHFPAPVQVATILRFGLLSIRQVLPAELCGKQTGISFQFQSRFLGREPCGMVRLIVIVCGFLYLNAATYTKTPEFLIKDSPVSVFRVESVFFQKRIQYSAHFFKCGFHFFFRGAIHDAKFLKFQRRYCFAV